MSRNWINQNDYNKLEMLILLYCLNILNHKLFSRDAIRGMILAPNGKK